MSLKPVLEEAKEKIREIIAERQMGNEPVNISIGTLTTRQAIGTPKREGYALVEGKEVMIEAQVHGSFGQAFTDRPHEFSGSLKDVLGLDLKIKDNRALFVATLNAVAAHLGMVTGVRHCRDEEPEECASEIARYIMSNYGKLRVGLVGYQPAILEHLADSLGAENVRCTDLNPSNIGSHKFGVEIRDGGSRQSELIEWCELLLVTSSTIVNNTFDGIRAEAAARSRRLVNFGVTGAGVSAMLGLERVCFKAH